MPLVSAVVFMWFTNFMVESKEFNLTILHTNDVHSRFEDINKYGGPCTDVSGAKCYGGVARRYTKINEIRKNNKNTILMDAGDQFQVNRQTDMHAHTYIHIHNFYINACV